MVVAIFSIISWKFFGGQDFYGGLQNRDEGSPFSLPPSTGENPGLDSKSNFVSLMAIQRHAKHYTLPLTKQETYRNLYTTNSSYHLTQMKTIVSKVSKVKTRS